MASEGTPIIIKKKKSHGHAHHGGSWKVAYADFVTAMMAFFMVMWILGLSDESKTQISGYFNDPFGYSKTQPFNRNIVKFPGSPITASGIVKKQKSSITKNDKVTILKVQTAVEKAIEEAIKEGKSLGNGQHSGQPGSLKELLDHVEIQVNPDEGLRIEFLEDKTGMFFDSGSFVMKPHALQVVQILAPILKKAGRPLRIEGHTDARPYSRPDYDNMDLSQDRANALRRAMRARGVPGTQFESVIGYGSNRLKYKAKPFDAVNRRVSILVPFVKDGDETQVNLAADFKKDFRKQISLTPDINITRDQSVKDITKPEKKNFWSGGGKSH